MMKQTTINSCTINSNNTYDNTSGINFKKVYSEYNFPLPNNLGHSEKILFSKKPEELIVWIDKAEQLNIDE
ncbi:MAG: hypothetical protein ACI4XK_01540 [Bacilli bacterium]